MFSDLHGFGIWKAVHADSPPNRSEDKQLFFVPMERHVSYCCDASHWEDGCPEKCQRSFLSSKESMVGALPMI